MLSPNISFNLELREKNHRLFWLVLLVGRSQLLTRRISVDVVRLLSFIRPSFARSEASPWVTSSIQGSLVLYSRRSGIICVQQIGVVYLVYEPPIDARPISFVFVPPIGVIRVLPI